MQHTSPKFVAAPAADIMMSLVEDGDRQNESLNRSFDRLGFLVSLLGEEVRNNIILLLYHHRD